MRVFLLRDSRRGIVSVIYCNDDVGDNLSLPDDLLLNEQLKEEYTLTKFIPLYAVDAKSLESLVREEIKIAEEE